MRQRAPVADRYRADPQLKTGEILRQWKTAAKDKALDGLCAQEKGKVSTKSLSPPHSQLCARNELALVPDHSKAHVAKFEFSLLMNAASSFRARDTTSTEIFTSLHGTSELRSLTLLLTAEFPYDPAKCRFKT